jgi:hypothetical protein
MEQVAIMMSKAKECLKAKVKEMEGIKSTLIKILLYKNLDIKKLQEAVSDQFRLPDQTI